MTDLRMALAALPEHKRALFEELMRERGMVENTFPLSVAQRGIWFLEQVRPGNPAYVIPAALRLRGTLDVDVLRAAVAGIVRRHEALRTTFELRGGMPVQVVHPAVDVPVTEVDLRGQDVEGEALEQRIAAELAEPFDLTTGPLLRLRLLRLGERDRVLAVATHHLVSDGRSVGVFVSELSALYAAFTAGRPSSLPPPAIQYGDFAVWQNERAAGDLDYWRRHLEGAPAALELPTDRPRPAVQGFNGGSVPFELPAALMAGLGAVARQHRATPYMALLAVLQVLLHRWTGQTDVVVGVPTANRTRPEVESLIGFFVNTLPVRTDLAGDPTFDAVLASVRASCLAAYARQDVPFERIVEDQRRPRDLSRSPVFQVGLSYQGDPLPALEMAGVSISRVPLRARGARFDLELQFFSDDEGRLTGWFEYDSDLFEETSVAGLARCFRRLVEQVVDDPATTVASLELLDGAERERVLAAGAGPSREWPGVGLVHERVAEQARATPDAEAVRFEGRSLTYAELDRWANRLAHRLVRGGVGRDVPVAVSVPRSLELVVSLLAVLKAGGAYLPLDPAYPRARLAHMLDDAAAPVLLTRRDVVDGLPPTAAEALCVEELDLSGEPDTDPGVAVDGEDLAYVIYTSGSTGRPKGVMNVHAAIRNRLLWMQDAYRLGPDDRVLQKTPFSFDVSVWEFFWPLMSGATLVVAPPDAHRDSGRLIELIRSERITTLHFVPSMLQVVLGEPGLEECTSLRRVICSGEALPRATQERFFARSSAELHNLYGPTEAAIDVTHWRCRRDGDPRPVPIGFPIANTGVHVLDDRLRPVPTGVAGELHIAGRNLARGYLGRPALTAERFVEHPLGRLYKTGDRARQRSDGAVEYLGRLDDQVKLRGFRVELGEVGSALAEHPDVTEAVAVVRGDRLVAYLVAVRAVPAVELTAHLRERVPDYAVPSVFVPLPAIPLTPNGKLDHAALPEPDGARPEVATAFVAPGEGLPATIARLWCDVLSVDRVGAHDNFFDLGGHSLALARVRAALVEALGRDVSMVELFQYPTVAALAEHLARDGDAPALAGAARAEARRQAREGRGRAADRRARSRNGR
ncbi:amino acid adenylation domain-containing protein [Actinosynnema sp. NPDC059335]|uniref:amino acid adenylation domain-containing protein n=1 Tax=Actinosynnema sp. NPDC059335 TaxID=3346804 RepID=UPI0036723042